MFVTENYMHIEHRHTKGMGCLKQHNTGWKQHMERYIYDHGFMRERDRERQRQRQRRRQRDRETDRATDRLTN